MRLIDYRNDNYTDALLELDRRYSVSEEKEAAVKEILQAVRDGGDESLFAYTKEFDRAVLSSETIQVSSSELEAALESLTAESRKNLEASRDNIANFAKGALKEKWNMRNAQGVQVGEVYQPFERVGIYVPGGSAPLVSTALMTVTLAAAAGVPEIAVCTPCNSEGVVNVALLSALSLAGATEVYKVGGAQAIAAMAYGTESIEPVAKVFGPGNSFVVEAKRQVFGQVAIDLLPGPSESLVLADESARADWIAADLLAQAEHGPDSVVGLVSDSEALIQKVGEEIQKQAEALSRQKQLLEVLEKGLFAVLVENIEAGVQVVNDFAPEHLSLFVEESLENDLVDKITTTGAIYVGDYSPVAVGDFLAGPSHVLPTGGAGKSFSGLTVDQFLRKTSIVRLDKDSVAASEPIARAIAEMEGLDAHGRSVTIRTEG